MTELEQLPARNQAIERLERRLLTVDQVPVPLEHRFAPGVYLREVFMPAGEHGLLVIGHEHRTRHFNIVLEGEVSVLMDGKTKRIVGPCTFVSEPGVRKVLFIHKDTRWQTIHPTEETDIEKLEEMLIVKSDSFQEHRAVAEAQKLMIEIGEEMPIKETAPQ